MKRINLLWTGGLDSTFRLVELAHNEIEIQPYYIDDNSRPSNKNEKKAMKKIQQLLRKKPFTKAVIKDVKFISVDEVSIRPEIKEARENLYKINEFGSQYIILASFASQNNLQLEVGLESSDRSKATEILKRFGFLQLTSYTPVHVFNIDNWATHYKIDSDKANNDVVNIFQNLRFPAHLFNIEKIDEAELLNKWNCTDILKTTWFCHNPILGIPCGHCSPCKDAINEDMAWRVPKIGRVLGGLRYNFYKACGKVKKQFIK